MPDIRPRIAYDNAITTATLTATPSTTATGGGTANLKDWTPWTFWRPTGSGPFELVADFGSSKAVNCFAIAGHDCSGSVTTYTWNGAAWVQFATTTAADDGSVIYLTGESATTTKVRLVINDLSFAAVIFAGSDMTLPEGVGPGWEDPLLAQRAKTTTEVSRGGVFLGTAVEMWDADLGLDLKSVEATWVRDTWRPFVLACSTRPFLLNWNSDEWSAGACLCTSAKFGASPFAGRGYCDVSVSFTADTGYDRRLTP